MSSLSIAVIGLEEDECKLFIKIACGMPVPAGSGFKELGDDELQFYCRAAADMTVAVDGADRAILLVHHMDLLSVQRLRIVNEFMLKDSPPPYVWTILKPEGESEFKISCIECSQKITIPEGNQGSKARCPKCKKSFTVPTREEYLMMVLGIEDKTLVKMIEEGQSASIDATLSALAGQSERTDKPKTNASGKTKIRIRKKSDD